MILTISSALLEELQRYTLDTAPYEICGLMLGQGASVESLQPADNVAEDKVRHFEIDPAVLIAAERKMREGGAQIVGYYHSHPDGKTEPSKTDADCAAADGRIWLIVSGKTATAYQASENGEIFGRFNPIALDC